MRESAQSDFTASLDERVNIDTQSQFLTRTEEPSCTSICRSTSYCMPHCLSQPCLPVSNLGPSRILPYLYLGSQRDAFDLDTLNKNGISYIVNVTTCIPRPSSIQETNFHRIPVDDNYREQLIPFFHEAFQFLDKVSEAGACSLVHCQAGVSRSATIVIAYVMYKLGLTTDQAYRYVKDKRPNISPNFNFLGQLVEYEQQLKSSRPDDVTKPVSMTSPHSAILRDQSARSLYLAPPTVNSPAGFVASPTTALSRLSFTNLSPLEEHSSSPSTHSTPPTPQLLTNQRSGDSLVMSLSQSDQSSGVTIRLGAKHSCAGAKRPLSSPTMGAAHDGSLGGANFNPKRPTGRPNSIGIVPVGGAGRPGEGFNFTKLDFSVPLNRLEGLAQASVSSESKKIKLTTERMDVTSEASCDSRFSNCDQHDLNTVKQYPMLSKNILENDKQSDCFNLISSKASSDTIERVNDNPEVIIEDMGGCADIRDGSLCSGNISSARKTRSLCDMLSSGECMNDSLQSPSCESLLDSSLIRHKQKPALCETRSLGREFARISKEKRNGVVENSERYRAYAGCVLSSPITQDINVYHCVNVLSERSPGSLNYKQNSAQMTESPSSLCSSAEMISVS